MGRRTSGKVIKSRLQGAYSTKTSRQTRDRAAYRTYATPADQVNAHVLCGHPRNLLWNYRPWLLRPEPGDLYRSGASTPAALRARARTMYEVVCGGGLE